MTSRQLTRATLLALVAVGSLVWSSAAFAQEDPTARRAAAVDVPLAERSYVFRNIPNDQTLEIYEAFLALHFSLGGSMQDSYDEARLRNQADSNVKADWAVLPSLSMLVNLRQLSTDSAPVRTPSYLPRARLTVVRSNVPAPGTTTGQWVFEGTLGHYSNGQEGCTFQEQDPLRNCQFVTPVPDENLVANGTNGSFSSHYLEGAAARRWITWSKNLLPKRPSRESSDSRRVRPDSRLQVVGLHSRRDE